VAPSPQPLELTRTITLAQLLDSALRAAMFDVHTCLPAQVEKFDETKQTVDLTLGVQSLAQLAEDGSRTAAPIPKLLNVPVSFAGGGGFRATFPIVVGDTGLVVFSEANAAGWKASGGQAVPADTRRFHLADAFFVPGVHPASKPWSDVPASGSKQATWGMDGGPQLVVTGTEVHLGASPSSLATDYVALASLVKVEISKLRDTVNALVTAYNAHEHPAGAMLDSTSNPVTGLTAPTLSSATAPAAVSDVKSALVKSK
jgi:hypothetical protein